MPIDNDKTALFETLLSHTIIQKRELYEAIYIKIAKGIEELQKLNRSLEREMFAAFTFTQYEFELGKKTDSKYFQQGDFDLHAANHWHKVIFEKHLKKFSQVPPPAPSNTNSLFGMVQAFIAQKENLRDDLYLRLRAQHLFSEAGRGREELDENSFTQKFGILSEAKTPHQLRFFYQKDYVPGQFLFKAVKESSIVKFMDKYHLPFISGPSGTVADCYLGVMLLGVLSAEEFKTYLMVLAASLVARGHHSFYEVFMVLEFLKPTQNNYSSRKEFYESMLSQEFKASHEYQSLLETEEAKQILEDSTSIPQYSKIANTF